MARGETGLMRRHNVLNEIRRQTRRGCEERGSHIVLGCQARTSFRGPPSRDYCPFEYSANSLSPAWPPASESSALGRSPEPHFAR
jgi:hypothetical protein